MLIYDLEGWVEGRVGGTDKKNARCLLSKEHGRGRLVACSLSPREGSLERLVLSRERLPRESGSLERVALSRGRIPDPCISKGTGQT